MKHIVFAPLMLIAASGVAGAKNYESLPFPGGASAVIVIDRTLPSNKMLPEQSAPVPETHFVMLQPKGGNVFLGPLLGSVNISAKTKALAEASKGQYLDTDVAEIAAQALMPIGVVTDPKDGAYVLRPFSFIQKCDDEKFRIALVFHVDGPGTKNAWVGRYTYHLPTAIPVAQLSDPLPEQLAQFVSEMTVGAQALTALLQRDIRGELPATGKKVRFGSLNLIGSKLGGMGIYTPPEKLAFPDSQLIEETDGYVTVRIKGNPHGTLTFGGTGFGVHRIERSLVHTLSE